MPTTQTAAPEGERRRTRRRSKRSTSRKPVLGQIVFWMMTVLAIAASVFSAHQMRLASLMFGPLMLGMPREEVRYLRGEPSRISGQGRYWSYPEGAGGLTVIRFADNGLVDTMSCVQLETVGTGCPAPMGVGLGTTEDRLVNRLGPANDERYIEGGKLMYYAELGLMFTMREFRVTGITKVPRSGNLAFLPRLGWNILP